MLDNLRFPLIYLAELVLWLPLLASCYALTSFLAATPLTALDLHGKALPAGWEAAVHNHGRYWQGYLIENHPLAFALSVLLLAGSAALMYRVRQAQVRQRNAAGAAHAGAHKIAQLLVVAALAAIGYTLAVHVLAGVSPA